jgi:hypothetical protein
VKEEAKEKEGDEDESSVESITNIIPPELSQSNVLIATELRTLHRKI